jgi:hypothetical protein
MTEGEAETYESGAMDVSTTKCNPAPRSGYAGAVLVKALVPLRD